MGECPAAWVVSGVCFELVVSANGGYFTLKSLLSRICGGSCLHGVSLGGGRPAGGGRAPPPLLTLPRHRSPTGAEVPLELPADGRSPSSVHVSVCVRLLVTARAPV